MAKTFQFRLEVVERVRRQVLDHQRRAMAHAQRRVEATEALVADVSRQLREWTCMTREAKRGGRLDVSTLRSQQFHRGWLADQAIRAQTELSAQRASLLDERRKVAEAAKQLRVIEKLRKRQWRRFRVEENRREQMELDEIALRRFSGTTGLACSEVGG